VSELGQLVREMTSSMKKFISAGLLSLAMSSVAFAQTPVSTPEKTVAKSPALATPTADQILSRYVEAVGGAAAWKNLTSRVSTGTIEIPKIQISGTVEFHEKAPNRILRVIILNGATFRQGFDGVVAWTDDPQDGLRSETGAELEDTRFDSDFFHPLNLRKLYSKFTVTGTEKIGEHDAYVVEAVRAGSDPDKIFFDTKTGFALRLITIRHTRDGASTYQEDLEDYRDADGIRLPFIVHQSIAEPPFTIRLTEVHHNLELDDKEFSKPAAE
jgi:hypothetical protein